MGVRACANRRATFRTWHLSERLNSLLTTAWHIRYSPIGAASKLGPEANSESSDSEAGGKSHSEGNSKYSASEAISKSGPEASSIYSASEAGSRSGPEESLESVS